ncbi:hypothetical protein GPM19_07810 [Halomonas sp. ZH2S]|uniref:Uncharacterized protein n=1 Tax=Vreelandella zhuhanensis TaxID=2684210 RepID=A0A7X3KQ44_9GAMM|nr:hypothetical protein [Halomonas zhuhanensis]MWJ28109.1 hypothetical protein [Halomonas zhuhanensis]
MKRLHMKGRILQLINARRDEGIWDWELTDALMSEYGLTGRYWRGNTRVTLTDLFSTGIIESVEEQLDDQGYFGVGRVLFKFRLNAFGRQRMLDTELA